MGGCPIKYFNTETALLSNIYQRICIELKVSPDQFIMLLSKVRKRKYHKIAKRSLQNQQYAAYHDGVITHKTWRSLTTSSSLQDTLHLLYENYQQSMGMHQRMWEAYRKACENFSPRIQKCLSVLAEDGSYMEWEDIPLHAFQIRDGHTLQYDSQRCGAFSEDLIFHNAVLSGDCHYSDVQAAELSSQNGRYLLELFVCCNESPSWTVCIEFDRLSVEHRFFDYTADAMTDRHAPWCMVSNALWELKHKHQEYGENSLNAKEKALLPLCDFTPILLFCAPCCGTPSNDESIPQFLFYAARFGLQDSFSFVRKLSQCTDKKSVRKLIKKVQWVLCQKECFPLWQAIFCDLQEAACDYPSRVSLEILPETLAQERARVTETMHSLGFQGEYPSFRMLAAQEGISLRKIRFVSYVIGFEKHLAGFVDCREMVVDGNLMICYLSGTVRLKKSELDSWHDLDAYAAYFEDGSRRFAMRVMPNSFDNPMLSNDQTAAVAGKAAMLRKLSREERCMTNRAESSNSATLHPQILIFVLISYVLFILMLMFAAFLVCLMLALFTRQIHPLDFIYAVPWLQLFGNGLLVIIALLLFILFCPS